MAPITDARSIPSIFSSPSIITELLVVGDSMAGQLHYAIALAVASNKRLSQLHISHARVSVEATPP